MNRSLVVMILALFCVSLWLEQSLSQVAASTLECRYESKGWFRASEGELYTCEVQNRNIFNTGERIHIEGESGQHEENENNEKIQAVQIQIPPNMGKFPTGLAGVFSNLVGISCLDCKLKEITREDLSVFPKLKYLWLGHNHLTHLREDLFKNHEHLEVLSLYYNQIVHVDRGTFSKLSKLNLLDFDGNNCKLGGEARTKVKIDEIVKRVEDGECQSDAYTTS